MIRQLARDVAVRAVKTFCQASAALLVADGSGLIDTNYMDIGSVAGMAALVSVLTTVGSATFTGSPAAGEAVTPDAQVAARTDRETGYTVAGQATTVKEGEPVEVLEVNQPRWG